LPVNQPEVIREFGENGSVNLGSGLNTPGVVYKDLLILSAGPGLSPRNIFFLVRAETAREPAKKLSNFCRKSRPMTSYPCEAESVSRGLFGADDSRLTGFTSHRNGNLIMSALQALKSRWSNVLTGRTSRRRNKSHDRNSRQTETFEERQLLTGMSEMAVSAQESPSDVRH